MKLWPWISDASLILNKSPIPFTHFYQEIRRRFQQEAAPALQPPPGPQPVFRVTRTVLGLLLVVYIRTLCLEQLLGLTTCSKGVVGSVTLVTILVLAAFFYVRQRRRKQVGQQKMQNTGGPITSLPSVPYVSSCSAECENKSSCFLFFSEPLRSVNVSSASAKLDDKLQPGPE